jgi:hypothetical protein
MRARHLAEGGKLYRAHLVLRLAKEDTMFEDETKESANDPPGIAKSGPYEVADFARKHGLSMVEARGLIEKVGNDCVKLDAAAKKLKRH